MVRTFAIFVLSTALFTASAQAQVYRCGSSYQAMPCGDAGTKLDIPSGPGESSSSFHYSGRTYQRPSSAKATLEAGTVGEEIARREQERAARETQIAEMKARCKANPRSCEGPVERAEREGREAMDRLKAERARESDRVAKAEAHAAKLESNPAARHRAVAACVATLKARVKDLDSLKVGGSALGPYSPDVGVTQLTPPFDVAALFVAHNAKNSFGGYTGWSWFACPMPAPPLTAER